MVLDFDNSLSVHLVLRQGDHYDRVFIVKKNGVSFDWVNVTEIILEVKETKKSTEKIIELKLSTGEIEISPGQMTWHIPSSKTDIKAGEYKSIELLIVYSNTKPKLWFDGKCTVMTRGIKLG
ncbi:MAG: hypothetical protein HYS25_00855 [Ignavibacteriales bacterium]|nr:hypothetical protein [Ignavibacteriales bacterium]